MTAEIAVLNRSAVALAADSAVTIGSGQSAKVYNNANKLFTLSKYHPMGVMFYGSATYMGVPWETIIKEFREHINDNNYDTAEHFADELIGFIQSYVKCTDEHKKRNILQIWMSQLEELNDLMHRKITHERTSRPLSDMDVKLIIKNLIKGKLAELQKLPDASSMEGIDIDAVLANCTQEYEYAKTTELPGRPLTDAADKALLEYCGLLLKKRWFSPIQSGLVVAGFGKTEMFPSLYGYTIDGLIGDHLKIEQTASQDIARDKMSSIHAFAQHEMVVQFMEGMDRGYRRYFEGAVANLIERIADDLVNRLSGGNDQQKRRKATQIRRITSKMFNDLLLDANELRAEQYTSPVVQALSFLPKEELANLAEALVNLTSLKRRVSMAQETVGGDIDVAVISKGDGFIWIKRKHYFDPRLNPHFIRNYFRDYSKLNRREDHGPKA